MRWLKAISILERTTKLAFIDPEENSQFAISWSQYHYALQTDPARATKPPAYLDQPRYRCPKAFTEIVWALEQLLTSCGEDGIDPAERVRRSSQGQVHDPEVQVPPPVVMFVSAK